MNLPAKVFLVTTACFLFLLCEKDDNPFLPKEEGFVYPAAVGTGWEYDRVISRFNYRPFTKKAAQVIDTTITFDVSVVITRMGSIGAYGEAPVFEEQLSSQDGLTDVSETFYTNLDSGLYMLAYRGPSHMIPKSNRTAHFGFKGIHFDRVDEIASFLLASHSMALHKNDTLIIEDPPIRSLAYPLDVGSEWVYRRSQAPWPINKRVTRTDTVDVPAGLFFCYEIQWLFDINNDDAWDEDILFHDFIDSHGLIKRTILFKDVIIIGEEGPEPLGLCDVKDESVLTMLNQ